MATQAFLELARSGEEAQVGGNKDGDAFRFMAMVRGGGK